MYYEHTPADGPAVGTTAARAVDRSAPPAACGRIRAGPSGRCEASHPHPGEASEADVLGEDRVDPVLGAHRGDLGVEAVVAAGADLAEQLDEEPPVPVAGTEQAGDRAGEHAVDHAHRRRQVGGRVEHAGVGHDADELAHDEHRDAERSSAFGQVDHLGEGRVVLLGLSPVGVDQDVGVEGDQGERSRSS